MQSVMINIKGNNSVSKTLWNLSTPCECLHIIFFRTFSILSSSSCSCKLKIYFVNIIVKIKNETKQPNKINQVTRHFRDKTQIIKVIWKIQINIDIGIYRFNYLTTYLLTEQIHSTVTLKFLLVALTEML